MGDFFFVAKCFVATLVLVVLLQIKVGGRTLESHTVSWIHRSGVAHHLQDVAEGAVKVGKSGTRQVAALFEDKIDDIDVMPQQEASTGWFKVKRSAAYYKQKAREEKEARAKKRKAADDDVESATDSNGASTDDVYENQDL